MAKRSRKRNAPSRDAGSTALREKAKQAGTFFGLTLPECGIALLLALVAFVVYWPSLASGLVYDAKLEIEQEGFITDSSNLPAVLSLKVLGMHLMLADRPGQLLYMMLIAASWGKDPFGYHLCSNLLHAANVALLFILLLRLTKNEFPDWLPAIHRRMLIAISAVVLIFAVHPISTEAIAAVNYSSDLLVAFFTLLGLLAATAFRPENRSSAPWIGTMGALCALASVMCKESGVATCALLAVYWFLYRRAESKRPWFLFLGATTGLTIAFLTARFLFQAPSNAHPLSFLGGSFGQMLQVQPRFWVFMMGKLIWPVHFSADYTVENVAGLSTLVALVILVGVVALQGWLATRSRIGALGVAIYWLGLATVSNLIPLDRPLADRFYYVPLAGISMQLLAMLLMARDKPRVLGIVVTCCFFVAVPLTGLTWQREADEWKIVRIRRLHFVGDGEMPLMAPQE